MSVDVETDALPAGVLRRMSAIYSSLDQEEMARSRTNVKEERPGADGAFKLLSEHPHLSIVPSNIRKFYYDLEERIDHVEREARLKANREINMEALELLEGKDLERAVEALEKGQNVRIPNALPVEYAIRRANHDRRRMKENESWYATFKQSCVDECERFRASLKDLIDEKEGDAPIASPSVSNDDVSEEGPQKSEYKWKRVVSMSVTEIRNRLTKLAEAISAAERRVQTGATNVGLLEILKEERACVRFALREKYNELARRLESGEQDDRNTSG